MSATLENIRSYRGLTNDALKARLDAAGTSFIAPTYNPRKRRDMSDPRPTPDRVTDTMKAEVRERLGRGGNGMVSNTPTKRRVTTDNPDNPGRYDDGEPMRPQQERLVWVLLNRELRPINPDAADAGQRWFDDQKAGLTRTQCSAWIDRIRAMIAAGPAEVSVNTPTAPVVDTPAPKANAWARWRELAAQLVATSPHPSGARFAVDTEEGATNTIAFWWIVPGKNHHEGKFWLRQVIGGQGAVRVRLSVEAMISIAEKIIAAGPQEAMIRFGLELETCGSCGRELTNDGSRAAGIGPKCRDNAAW